MLTKKFINLIEKAPNGVLDLNHAAEMLQVGIAWTGSRGYMCVWGGGRGSGHACAWLLC